MKVEIPDQLKADVPQSLFGKILAATPVIMAVVATMLAGLSSSEMTRAQYDRSLAAQQQSKAGDQWSFFQAKRLRGSFQRNTAELVQTLAAVHPLDLQSLRSAAQSNPQLAALLQTNTAAEFLVLLQHGEMPAVPAAPPDPKVQAALSAMEHVKSDTELAAILAEVPDNMLTDLLRAASQRAQAFDSATRPVIAFTDRLAEILAASTAVEASTGRSILRDFGAARLRHTAARYEIEARQNQFIANLYELQVRKSNISAERHHARSQKFFYGMLGAQLGVIVATFAMAARQRNFLWSIAAAAGLIAVAFAVYVYLYI